MTVELPPCQECGACCVTNLEYGRGGFVRLQETDYNRLPPKYRLTVVADSEEGMDRLGTKGSPAVGYRCVALQGEVHKKVSCRIYEARPQVCRAFERGSHDCRKEYANWKFGSYQR